MFSEVDIFRITTIDFIWKKKKILIRKNKKNLYANTIPMGPGLHGCSGHSWDEPNFPHSSLHGTMFCIYNENSVDNMGIF